MWLSLVCLDVPSPFERMRRHPQPRVTGHIGGAPFLWCRIVYPGRLGTEITFALTGFYCKLLYHLCTSWDSGLFYQFLPKSLEK
ncbi:putative pentaxin [Helianthus annuus]|nr:putative pentaxin [Helianthus annuus]